MGSSWAALECGDRYNNFFFVARVKDLEVPLGVISCRNFRSAKWAHPPGGGNRGFSRRCPRPTTGTSGPPCERSGLILSLSERGLNPAEPTSSSG